SSTKISMSSSRERAGKYENLQTRLRVVMHVCQIPKSIGSCKNLLQVLFLNNKFSGCLPVEIGNLNKAKIFDLGGNSLAGPIPASFSCLSAMDTLNLARNKLGGAVLEALCELPKIVNLSLSDNYFTQVGPACRALIKKKILDMRWNCIWICRG
ncbi:Uncharacterized protein At4g06744, partial [Linum perenne]